MMKGRNKILARSLITQTLGAMEKMQYKKQHDASTEEQVTIKHNPYIIFHQALRSCEPSTQFQR